MSDAEMLKRIETANFDELFHIVMCDPSWLTDSYYADFGRAIRKRYEALKGYR